MPRKVIKHKPITHKEYDKLIGFNPITDLSLHTGARIMEIKRLIDKYEDGDTILDVETKKSNGIENRFFLNEIAIGALKKLKKFKGVSKKTIYREYKRISDEIGIEFTSHNLRSTFCTRLIELGVDLVSVSHLMHHSNINQTAQYIQFNENRYGTAVEMLYEYKTIDGLTLPEAIQEIYKLKTKIKRIEKDRERLQENAKMIKDDN